MKFLGAYLVLMSWLTITLLGARALKIMDRGFIVYFLVYMGWMLGSVAVLFWWLDTLGLFK